MKATPHSYPVLAQLRYAYYEAGEASRVVENAWWESRWGGGRSLGAVVEAWDHPVTPHRSRVHLEFNAEFAPLRMIVSLLRPDGEGQANYRFSAERVDVEGIWRGKAFAETVELPSGYTVAPHCLSADGLHFRESAGPEEQSHTCFLLDPRRSGSPLSGRCVSFTSQWQGKEELEVGERRYPVARYRTAYDGAPDRPADFRVMEGVYALRMTSMRGDGSPFEIRCVKAVFSESQGVEMP